MALTLSIPISNDLTPRITVIGVGGAGGNAVNNMIENSLEGCEFIVANTDHQALQQSRAGNKLQLGARVTEGLGAGARPEVGAAAAEESIEEIVDRLVGCHMCFITAGMGGGTGTGAAPIIARAAREMGILTVGVVTKPFQFEGARRMRQAEGGLDELQKHVDTLIIIPNQNLFRIANEKTTFTEAFSLADDVLYQGVKGVTDLMVRPGIINLDFADVRSVMNEMGKAMMGTGEASGEERAVQAAEKAIANPLLDEISLKGARGVLINITAGPDLTLFELDEAANRIRAEVDQDANIMVGSTLDPEMTGMMRVSVVATGIDALARSEAMPLPRRPQAEPAEAPAPERTLVRPADPRGVAPRPQPVQAPAHAHAHAHGHALPHAQAESFYDEPEAEAEPVPQPRAAESVPQPGALRGRGEPSAEALARLQRAVQRVPKPDAARGSQPAPAAPREPERQTRLTINSLIHRMTGHGSRDSEPARKRVEEPAPAPRAMRPVEPELDEGERERAEIPAFLRRQAN
jgi:cell division protein FtsZ